MNTLENARTQYNDLTGSVAADFFGHNGDINDYAKGKGIDVEKYRPIGLEIHMGERGDGFYLSFIVIDKQKQEAYKNSNDLPVLKIRVKETHKGFRSRFKDFNIVLVEPYQDYNKIDVIDTIELTELK